MHIFILRVTVSVSAHSRTGPNSGVAGKDKYDPSGFVCVCFALFGIFILSNREKEHKHRLGEDLEGVGGEKRI